MFKALFGSYSREEADENSEIAILVEATPEFVARYGSGAIARIQQIQKERTDALGITFDLADSSGMGKTGKKSILDRAIYV